MRRLVTVCIGMALGVLAWNVYAKLDARSSEGSMDSLELRKRVEEIRAKLSTDESPGLVAQWPNWPNYFNNWRDFWRNYRW